MTSKETLVPKTKSLLWLLVKNRLMAQLGIHIYKHEKDKRKKNSRIALTIAIGICILVLLSYSAGIAYGYSYLGLTELIPGIAMVISSLLTLAFTMFKTNGELFHYNDYDMIMSLPISVRTVVNSRFLNMFIWNTFMTFLVMFPMGIVYASFMKPSFGFYVMWLIGILLASMIPTTLAAVLGALITAVSARFKYAHAVSTILSLLLVIGIVVISMTMSTDSTFIKLFDSQGNPDTNAFKSLAPVISESLNKVYPPVKLFTRAVVDMNLGSFFLFIGISIGWYELFIYLLSLKYKQINTALTSQKSNSSYVLRTLHEKSMLLALYKKTILRILKSTVCTTNLLIGCLLAIVLSIAIVIVGPEKVVNGLDAPEYMGIVKNGAAYLISGMVCMANTSIISLSLEGKNVWLIHSLPIAPKTLYDSYLLTNWTFTLPTSLLCSILFSVSLHTGIAGTIILIVTPVIYALFTSIIGIFIGNRLAYYDWPGETQLVKQSFLSMMGILGGMIFIIICGTIVNAGILPVNSNTLTIILDIILLVLALFIYKNESTRPIKK